MFAGIVDGRNVWITDLHASLEELKPWRARRRCRRFDRLLASAHPVDLDAEPDLDDELRSWMAFATQKVAEVATLAQGPRRGLGRDRDRAGGQCRALETARSRSAPATRGAARVESLDADADRRDSPFDTRREAQRSELGLPQFPTTTIGSYPQTQEIRTARASCARARSTAPSTRAG